MRKPRLLFSGGLYHVIVRGNEGQNVFASRVDYLKYLTFLADALEAGNLKLYSYCLMPNHVHLLLEQAGDYPLSRFMQRLQTGYTQYFNRKHKKTGHLFQGRYKSILVDKDIYLKELVRYIQLNPIRSKLAEKPGDYVWTGYSQYAGKVANPAVKVETEFVPNMFGADLKESQKAYKLFVIEGLKEGHRRDYYEVRRGHIMGGAEFERKVHENAGKAMVGASLKLQKKLPDIWQALLHRDGHEKDLTGRKRSVLLAEAAYLATEGCDITQQEVGDYFGLKQSGVSRAVRRLQKKWNEEPHLKEKWNHWVRVLEKS